MGVGGRFTPWLLYPQEQPWYLLEEAGCATGLVLTDFGQEKIPCPIAD